MLRSVFIQGGIEIAKLEIQFDRPGFLFRKLPVFWIGGAIEEH